MIQGLINHFGSESHEEAHKINAKTEYFDSRDPAIK